MMRLAIFLLASVMALGSAQAGKHAGVAMPDKVTVANKQLQLNGMGVREATFMKVDVYVAGLYVQNVTSNPSTLINADEPKMLMLKFVRDVERKDIVDAWNQGFRSNATVPAAKLKPYIDQLNSWMPEFKHGDTLAFIYTPGEGVAVEVNNERKGVIKDPDFARSLFSIWLGPNPPTADLKRGLLGKHPKAG
jgi:hypothetical protein